MISKERLLIEFNATTRLLLWGEAAFRLVVLFIFVLYICCSNTKNEYKVENLYCQDKFNNPCSFLHINFLDETYMKEKSFKKIKREVKNILTN
jgi:hypothetical protein